MLGLVADHNQELSICSPNAHYCEIDVTSISCFGIRSLARIGFVQENLKEGDIKNQIRDFVLSGPSNNYSKASSQKLKINQFSYIIPVIKYT